MSIRKITQAIFFTVLTLLVGTSNGGTYIWASTSEGIVEDEGSPPPRKTHKSKKKKSEKIDSTIIVPSSSRSTPDLVLGGGANISEDRSLEIDDRTPQPEIRIRMQNQDNDVDLQEDVPGCEDNYYRCCLCCFRITRGWVDLGIALTLVGGAVCTGITTYATLDDATLKIIGTITTVGLIAGAGLKAFKTYLVEAAITRTEDLRTVIRQSHQHRQAQQGRQQNQVLEV